MALKFCHTCSTSKPLEEFDRRKRATDGRQSRCKECKKVWYQDHKEHHKKQVQRTNRRRQIRNYDAVRIIKEDNPCSDCGGHFPAMSMQFDHLGDKNFAISTSSSRSWKMVQEEIDKCELVCSNCHFVRTWQRKVVLRHIEVLRQIQPSLRSRRSRGL